ncbi:MAG: hypothetical protein HOW97_09360 [Catenulispora sp.]|nr:hypothetical protein [Catenulispora sp.]
MARVVCVHGIGKQSEQGEQGRRHDGERTLLNQWHAALSDGLRRAGHERPLPDDDVAMAYYGDLFDNSPYSTADIGEGFEQQLLLTWWAGAAAVDSGVSPPDAAVTLAAAPHAVHSALRALSGSKFFAHIPVPGMVADLKQMHAYLTDPRIRASVRARVLNAIGPDTRVVVAHSLGSVAAYEVLCALGAHHIKALVTLGSPLGIPNLVFERLDPAPGRKPAMAAWPGPDTLTWTNIADRGDVVALVKDLRPRFSERVLSALVDNGAHAHDATRYLTDAFCGDAVVAGLA